MKFFHVLLLVTWLLLSLILKTQQKDSTPVPTPWPEQFHSLLYTNLSTSRLMISNMWYDWPKGRNVYFRQQQLDKLLYDVQWNNGTNYYYTLGDNSMCHKKDIEVGIVRPNFLDGADYLGIEEADGFLCHVWTKVEFIRYYEDIATHRPVKWDFSAGISTHVITYEVGVVLEDSKVQAPAYCFNHDEHKRGHEVQISTTEDKDIFPVI